MAESQSFRSEARAVRNAAREKLAALRAARAAPGALRPQAEQAAQAGPDPNPPGGPEDGPADGPANGRAAPVPRWQGRRGREPLAEPRRASGFTASAVAAEVARAAQDALRRSGSPDPVPPSLLPHPDPGRAAAPGQGVETGWPGAADAPPEPLRAADMVRDAADPDMLPDFVPADPTPPAGEDGLPPSAGGARLPPSAAGTGLLSGGGSDLADLPGAGPGLVWLLEAAGIHSLAELAAADLAAIRARVGPVAQLINLESWALIARQRTGG